MTTEPIENRSFHVGRGKLLAFVREMIGASRGREDDDHPLPPGPWDPVIRVALEHTTALGQPSALEGKRICFQPTAGALETHPCEHPGKPP